MYCRISIFLSLILVLNLSAKESPLNTLTVESETAGYVQIGNWDGVIKSGKEALKQGIDFYNLRYRMGMAYYYKKNYHEAIRHFYKAILINTSDPILNEYVYWAYYYAGNFSEARLFASGLSREMRKRAGIPEKMPGDYFTLAFNYGFPEDKDFTDYYSSSTDTAVNGAQFLSRKLVYADFGIHKILTPRLSAFAIYSRIKKTSFLYAQENGYAVIKPEYETHLNQIYLSYAYHLMRNTDLTMGAHFINIRYQRDKYVTDGLSGRIETDDISENDGLAFISIYHRFPYVTTGATALTSNLNNKEQIQGDFNCVLYPLGNLNLYVGLTLSYHYQNPDKKKIITEYQLGGKVLNKVWSEIYVTYGNLKNASRYQGYVIYNGMDAVTKRMGGRFIIIYSHELSFTLNYVYQNHESYFNPENTTLFPVNPFTYSSHAITGALRWNF